MRIIELPSYEQISRAAADAIAYQLRRKPDSVLGLCTGTTPLGAYELLGEMCRAGQADFSRVTTFNLDEYCGLEASSPDSYHSFMHANLFSKINIDPANTHLPSCEGEAAAQAACDAYERAIEQAGGIDLQLLGIGGNGHIGFNEPSDVISDITHVVRLTESTIKANSRLFGGEEAKVPRTAVTMGVGTILRACRIVLICGAGKYEILQKAAAGPITPQVPASLLRLHPDCTVWCERQAHKM